MPENVRGQRAELRGRPACVRRTSRSVDQTSPSTEHTQHGSTAESKTRIRGPVKGKGKAKGSPYSTAERRVPELIPVLGSQPAGDMSHKPGGRLPLLSARPAITLATLKRAATNFAVGKQRHDGREQFA